MTVSSRTDRRTLSRGPEGEAPLQPRGINQRHPPNYELNLGSDPRLSRCGACCKPAATSGGMRSAQNKPEPRPPCLAGRIAGPRIIRELGNVAVSLFLLLLLLLLLACAQGCLSWSKLQGWGLLSKELIV